MSDTQPKLPLPALALIGVLVIVIVCTFILASVPPVSRDALTHHLFVPKLYIQNGGIYEIPEVPPSYYPMNLDLLYMIPLYFGNDIIPKYIHFAFGLGTAWLIYRFVKQRIGITWGLMGALFFVTIPIIIKLSITVYVDLGLVFLSTAALIGLIAWLNDTGNLKYLVVSGLCGGLAAGTKYNGLITIFILVLFVPFFYARYSAKNSNQSELKLTRNAIVFGLIFITAASVSYGPWLIRNYMWTGNPIYPLHNQLFVSEENNKSADAPLGPNFDKEKSEATQNSNIFVMRRNFYGETALETLLLPVRFFIEGRDDNPRYFDGKLNPFLLVLPFITFIWMRKTAWSQKEKEFLILFTFAVLYFFLAFFQSAMRIRYIAPSLPPLIILSTFGLHTAYSFFNEKFSKHKKNTLNYWLTPALIIIVLSPNIRYLYQQFKLVQPFTYLSEKVSREEYITKFRPEYEAISWLNSRTSPSTNVLCFFLGNRGYYMDFKPVFLNRVNSSMNNADKDAEYVLVRNDLFVLAHKTATQNNQQINLPFSYEEPLFTSHGHSVYSIQP